MKVQFYGKIQIGEDEWVDLDTAKTIFDVPDEIEPFFFFQNMVPPGTNYLVSYSEVQE